MTATKYGDYDIGNALNLLEFIDDETYLYPKKSIISNDSTEKKKLLVIADSFFNNLHKIGLADDIFNLTGYWYYNKTVIQDKSILRKDIDLAKTIENTDLVLIVLTEWNLYRFGFGIIEELKINYGDYSNMRPADVTEFMNRIAKDKKWYDKVKVQAKERNISVDSMLVRSAMWYIKNKKKSN